MGLGGSERRRGCRSQACQDQTLPSQFPRPMGCLPRHKGPGLPHQAQRAWAPPACVCNGREHVCKPPSARSRGHSNIWPVGGVGGVKQLGGALCLHLGVRLVLCSPLFTCPKRIQCWCGGPRAYPHSWPSTTSVPPPCFSPDLWGHFQGAEANTDGLGPCGGCKQRPGCAP